MMVNQDMSINSHKLNFFKGVVCVKNIWVIRYKVRNHRMKNYIGCKIGIRGMFIKNL